LQFLITQSEVIFVTMQAQGMKSINGMPMKTKVNDYVHYVYPPFH